MWRTDPFLDLPPQCIFQYIHSCMYGGKRRKSTAFLNFSAPNLMRECDNSHNHLPWGLVQTESSSELKFSTSLETEYPAGLCKQLALAFHDTLQKSHKWLVQPTLHMDQAQRVGSGLQPRGARAPILLSDYKFKIDITSQDVPVPNVIHNEVHHPFQGIPINAKLLSSQVVCEVGNEGEKSKVEKSTFGVFSTPMEFLRRTLDLEHPLDNPSLVDKSNLKAILKIRDWSTAEVLQYRAKQLKKYMLRASELADEEATLKRSLDPDVRKVLESKRLLLFKEMASDAGVGDETLFSELSQGFRLTGVMPQSNQFPIQWKPAMISIDQLKDSSVWARKMTHSSCRRVGSDPEIAAAVYEETQQQLKDGWVKGPYTARQLDERYGGCWIPSKRFGVRQGEKIRAVDDFSEFLINASVTSTEKLQLFGLDEVVNTARTFLGCEFLESNATLDDLSCSPRVEHFQ